MEQEHALWVEKYRPKSFAEVKGQKEILAKIKAFIAAKNMPHLMFAGPAGVGKCVVGETPILRGNGEILSIKEAYEKKIQTVLALNGNGELEEGKITYFYKDKARELISIETQSGNSIKTTKEHPFLVLENGIPKWKHAEMLNKGDKIAIPTKYKAKEKEKRTIVWPEKETWAIVKKPMVTRISELYAGIKKEVLEFLEIQRSTTTSEIANAKKRNKKTILWAVRALEKEGHIRVHPGKPLKIMIDKILIKTNQIPYKNAKKEDIAFVYHKTKYHNASSPVIYFNMYSPVFFEWLGLLLGDGSTGQGFIRFHNNNKELRDHFTKLSYKIFGNRIIIKDYPNRRSSYVVISKAKIITKFLEYSLNIPINKNKAGIIRVPNDVFTLPKKHASMLIRGFYECDGYFSKKQKYIEISSKSNTFICQLKYLLLRFCIFSRIKKKKEQSYLTISGGEHLKKFSREIKPIFKKIDNIKYEETNLDQLTIPNNLNKILKNLGIRHKDIGKRREVEYIFQRRRASRRKIKWLYKNIVNSARERITDAIKTKELIENIRGIDVETIIKHFTAVIDDRGRNTIQEMTNIRYDRLKEYVDRKRTPSLTSFMRVMNATNADEGKEIRQILALRWAILETIRKLNISYSQIDKNTGLACSTTISILNKSSIAIQSISELQHVYMSIKEEIENRICSEEMIQTLEVLEFLSRADIQWDNVKTKEREKGDIVYDLNVEKHHNFIGGFGPMVLHNSTTAIVIARELFGEQWRENFLELNASDERGIDVVRTKVKDFARTKALGNVPFKIIFLDEADALTKEAQQALRRTMENYTLTTRFIISVNYSSKIIDPIQSRCTVFRFKPLEKEQMFEIFEKIAKQEGIEIEKSGKEAIYVYSEGDCRRAENVLQSCAAVTKKVTEEDVYSLVSVAKPKEINEFLHLALQNKFIASREKMLDTMLRHGLSGLDLIKQIQKEIWNLSISDQQKVFLVDKCGEIEFRMTEGADEFMQLEAFLAQMTLCKR